ncbi:MAG: transporter substrate-binding domain-containing protein [Burkholderiaceae bacterium]|nr:transporter substrate-binding domain-containing protein [Burkholderiaceae bacterium]
MKRALFTLVGLLCAASFQIEAEEKIHAVTEEFAPFNHTENGKVTGYSTQVVEELLERAGMPYDLAIYPWSRSYKMAQTLPNVLIFTLARTPDREKEFQWIGALAKRKLYLYRLAARRDINVVNLEDAKRYRISVNRDDAAERLLLDLGFSYEKNLDLSPSDESSLKKLLAGRIDFITGNDFTIAHRLKMSGVEPSRVRRSAMLIDQGEYYVAASKATSPEVVNRLRAAFQQMEKEGVIKRLEPKID